MTTTFATDGLYAKFIFYFGDFGDSFTAAVEGLHIGDFGVWCLSFLLIR